jgi:hypothetical protein
MPSKTLTTTEPDLKLFGVNVIEEDVYEIVALPLSVTEEIVKESRFVSLQLPSLKENV